MLLDCCYIIIATFLFLMKILVVDDVLWYWAKFETPLSGLEHMPKIIPSMCLTWATLESEVKA